MLQTPKHFSYQFAGVIVLTMILFIANTYADQYKPIVKISDTLKGYILPLGNVLRSSEHFANKKNKTDDFFGRTILMGLYNNPLIGREGFSTGSGVDIDKSTAKLVYGTLPGATDEGSPLMTGDVCYLTTDDNRNIVILDDDIYLSEKGAAMNETIIPYKFHLMKKAQLEKMASEKESGVGEPKFVPEAIKSSDAVFMRYVKHEQSYPVDMTMDFKQKKSYVVPSIKDEPQYILIPSNKSIGVEYEEIVKIRRIDPNGDDGSWLVVNGERIELTKEESMASSFKIHKMAKDMQMDKCGPNWEIAIEGFVDATPSSEGQAPASSSSNGSIYGNVKSGMYHFQRVQNLLYSGDLIHIMNEDGMVMSFLDNMIRFTKSKELIRIPKLRMEVVRSMSGKKHSDGVLTVINYEDEVQLKYLRHPNYPVKNIELFNTVYKIRHPMVDGYRDSMRVNDSFLLYNETTQEYLTIVNYDIAFTKDKSKALTMRAVNAIGCGPLWRFGQDRRTL